MSALSLHPTFLYIIQFNHTFIYNEFHSFAARLLKREFNYWTIYIPKYLALSSSMKDFLADVKK